MSDLETLKNAFDTIGIKYFTRTDASQKFIPETVTFLYLGEDKGESDEILERTQHAFEFWDGKIASY